MRSSADPRSLVAVASAHLHEHFVQTRRPLWLLGPQASLQPQDVVSARGVEGMQIDPMRWWIRAKGEDVPLESRYSVVKTTPSSSSLIR